MTHLHNANGKGSAYSIFGDVDPNNLEPQTIHFQMGGKWYVLREADKGAAVVYQQHQIRGMELVEKDGERHMKTTGVAEADPHLLARCLYYGDDEGNLRLNKNNPDTRYLVPIHVIMGWPAKIVDPLVKKLKEISNIDQEKTREQLEKELKDAQEALAKLDKKEGRASGEQDPTNHPNSSTPHGAQGPTTEPSVTAMS